jgi:hypothetical protein
MSDTKVRRRPGESSLESRELQIPIACSGKSAEQVLEELEGGLKDAAEAGRDPLVVLEELGRLQDSVVAFIKGLSRMLPGYPRTVTFWETSGYTEAFLSVMEFEGDRKHDPPSVAPGSPRI